MAQRKGATSRIFDGMTRGFGAGIGYQLARSLMAASKGSAESQLGQRVSAMQNRLRTALWRYALSHGECATKRQITEQAIFPARENATAIEADLVVVSESISVFGDTGSLTPSRLEDMSLAVGRIERHLAQSQGKSELPKALQKGVQFVSMSHPEVDGFAKVFLITLGVSIFLGVNFTPWLGVAASVLMLLAFIGSRVEVGKAVTEARALAVAEHAPPAQVMKEMAQMAAAERLAAAKKK